ncbi:MAG: hypothetical protein Q7U08_00260 [Flavobacteriaceae bacterium]|jgi:hypothetical protein|nr:hypothetical protein [Flavobacteriaceae bacterium]
MYRNLLIVTGLLISITSCSGVKKTQSALHSGNYDQAIDIAVDNLKTNKNKKSKQDYVVLLEEAFVKAVERDEKKLKLLKQENNPSNLNEIYAIYNNLDRRQEIIIPLLPLNVQHSNRNARFSFKDYTDELVDAKNRLSHYLYQNAIRLLTTQNKLDAQTAHQDLTYLNRINPNYKNVSQLLEEAHFKGTDFVLVNLMNDTPIVIPRRLEDDLLNFNALGLNNFWTVYHTQKDAKISYDIQMIIRFKSIEVSPEQIKERIVIKEKEIKEGFVYVVDKNGNVKKDSLGNDIKKDKFVKIRSEVLEVIQHKAARVGAQVDFIDLRNNQLINSFPVASEFIFEHHFATFKGDRRALEAPYIDWINRKFVPFPTSEQMIYDTGEDLKEKIKAIVKRQKF